MDILLFHLVSTGSKDIGKHMVSSNETHCSSQQVKYTIQLLSSIPSTVLALIAQNNAILM